MDFLDGQRLWSVVSGSDISLRLTHLIPYIILLLNYLFFKLFRVASDRLIANLERITQADAGRQHRKATPGSEQISRWYVELVKLLTDELISTCELCADCAELNVVYELHGQLAYGLTLFVLTQLVWLSTFGRAHTTPGYLVEELCLIKGRQVWREAGTYARLLGQLLGLKLAWRFASVYWTYGLMQEHLSMLRVDECWSALNTSTSVGLLVELTCCMLCRLCELTCELMHERGQLSTRGANLANALASSILVVLALDISGGYFNPVLAASLEYGCLGIQNHQHAIVFWLGPLLGHLGARVVFKWLIDERPAREIKESSQSRRKSSRTRRNRTASKRRD